MKVDVRSSSSCLYVQQCLVISLKIEEEDEEEKEEGGGGGVK